jgi:hypothetical protein
MRKTYFISLILILTCAGDHYFSNIGAALAACAAQVPAAQGSRDLSLDARPTKQVYTKGGPVELDITLRNIGKSPQIVARRLSLGMRITFVILYPDGKPVTRCGVISDEIVVLRGNYKTLSPGEAVRKRLTITCDDTKDSRSSGYVLDRSGKYLIKAAYLLPVPKEEYKRAFPDVNVIQGPIWADPVTIEVQ